MTPRLLETVCFLLACLGAVSHLNDMSRTGWRSVVAFALIAGGAFGCALEPYWPTLEPLTRLVLAVGLALAAAPILRRDVMAAIGRPIAGRVDRRHYDGGAECAAPEGGIPHFERRFERRA